MRIFLGILAALGIIIGVACYFLADIAQSQITHMLQQKNVPVASFTVSSVTPTSVTLSNVALGEKNALVAKSITLVYRGGTSLESLRLRIVTEGLQLQGKHYANAVRIGGVERLWEPSGIEAGALKTRFSLQGDTDITVSADQYADGEITFKQLTLEQKELKVIATNGEIRPRVDAQEVQVRYEIANVVAMQKSEAILAPLHVKGDAEMVVSNGEVKHHTTLHAVDLPFQAEIKGMHIISTQAGTATLSVPETAFEPAGLTFAALAPSAAKGVTTPPLKVKLASDVSYKAGGEMTLRGVLDVLGMPVGNIIASALGKGASMEGAIAGTVPFEWRGENNWRLKNAALANAGPMKLTLLPVPAEVGGLVNALTAVLSKQNAPQGALNEVNVSKFTLSANSTDGQGNLLLKGAVEGFNPLLKRPVNLNLNLTTNLRDLLRSASQKSIERMAQ